MSMNLFDLTGRAVIVTGAGRGLGRTMASGLAAAGADVAVAARSRDEVEQTARDIREAGGTALPLTFDARDAGDCRRLVDEAAGHFGRLDAMVVNHGRPGAWPAEEITPEDWRDMIDVNLNGCFYCAQAAGRRMLAQGGGSIVLVSSTASLYGHPKLAAYGAGKGGVDQLCRQLAVEWADRGVRVNTINPGYMTHHMRGAESRHADPAVEEEARRMTPMRRRGRPDELVGPVVFLVSDASSFVTGHILPVDGGYCAY